MADFNKDKISTLRQHDVKFTGSYKRPNNPFLLYGYSEHQSRWPTIPDNIVGFRQQHVKDVQKAISRHAGSTTEIGIYRQLKAQSHYGIPVQQALDVYQQITGGKFQNHVLFDMEVLGDASKYHIPTEVSFRTMGKAKSSFPWKAGKELSMLISPSGDDADALLSVINKASRNQSLKDWEWRAARDLIAYEDTANMQDQLITKGVYSKVMTSKSDFASKIPAGTSLSPYKDQMLKGLENLRTHGMGKSEAARYLHGYIDMVDQDPRSVFVSFKGRTADIPWLNQFFANHGLSSVGMQRHLDMSELLKGTGAHRALEPPTGRRSIQTLEYLTGVITGKDTDIRHAAFSDVGSMGEGFKELSKFIDRHNLIKIDSKAAFTPIGTGLTYDTRSLRIGDEIFTTAGAKSDVASKQISKGAYDFIIEDGQPNTYMTVGMRKHAKYKIEAFDRMTIGEKEVYRVVMDAPDLGIKSVMFKETPEEFQHLFQTKTVPIDFAKQYYGYGTKDYTKDLARRDYMRLFEVGQGKSYGERLGITLYGRFTGDTLDLTPSGLTKSQQRILEYYGEGRMRQEAPYAKQALKLIDETDNLLTSSGKKGLYQWQRDLMFAKSMSELSPHTMRYDLQPHERMLQVRAPLGTMQAPTTVGEGVHVPPSRYARINIAEQDSIVAGLHGTLNQGIENAPHGESIKYDRIANIAKDLRQRGIIDSKQEAKILSASSADLRVHTLATEVRGLAGYDGSFAKADRGFIDVVDIPSVHMRPGKLRSMEGWTQDVQGNIGKVLTAQKVFSRKALDHKMISEATSGLSSYMSKDNLENYNNAIYRLLKDANYTNLKTIVEPALDATGKTMIGVNLAVVSGEMGDRAFAAGWTGQGTDIPGGLKIELPIINKHGLLQRGRMERIGAHMVTKNWELLSGVESLAHTLTEGRDDRVGKLHVALKQLRDGDPLGAQKTIDRATHEWFSEKSSIGQRVSSLNRDMSARDIRGSSSDILRQELVDLSEPVEARAIKIMKDRGYKPWQKPMAEYDAAHEIFKEARDKRQLKIYATGKESDVAEYVFSFKNVRNLEPLGGLINPTRSNLFQFHNYMRIDNNRLRDLADSRGIDFQLLTSDIISTQEWEDAKETMRSRSSADSMIGRSSAERHISGINMKSAMMTDVDITERITKTLSPGTVKPADMSDADWKFAREWLESQGHRLSTWENMAMMSSRNLEYFGVELEKPISLTYEQGMKLQENLQSKTFKPGDTIIDDIIWKEKARGTIRAINPDAQGFRLRMSYLDMPQESFKVAASSGEKMTITSLPPSVLHALTEDSSIEMIYAQDIKKHADVGAMIRDRVQLQAYEIRTMEAVTNKQKIARSAKRQELVDDLNKLFEVQEAKGKAAKAVTWERVNQALIFNESATIKKGKEEALAQHISRDKDFIRTMTQVRRMRVDDHMYTVDYKGRVRIGSNRIPHSKLPKGMKITWRELAALETKSPELNETLEWLYRHIEMGSGHDTSLKVVQGNILAAKRFAGDELATKHMQELVYTTDQNVLRHLAKPIEEAQIGSVDDTILRPRIDGRLVSPGDTYALKLPAPISKSLLDRGVDDNLVKVRGGFSNFIPDGDITHVPMVAQDLAQDPTTGKTWMSNDVVHKQKALQDAVYNYSQSLSNAGDLSTPIPDAQRDVARAINNLYDSMATQTAGKKGLVSQDLLSGRMWTSSQVRLQGISPWQIERMQGTAMAEQLKENTLFISERRAKTMLGDNYSKFFGDFNKYGMAEQRTAMHGLGIRFPDIHPDQIDAIKIGVMQGTADDAGYITPGLMKRMRGDFDDDRFFFSMAFGGTDPEQSEKARLELQRYWNQHHGQSVDPRLLYEEELMEKTKEGLKVPKKIRGIEAFHAKKILLEEEVLKQAILSDSDVLGSKLSKKLIGLASNLGDTLRFSAMPYYDMSSEVDRAAYKHISDFSASIPQYGAISAKHTSMADAANHPLFKIQDILFQGRKDLSLLDQLTDVDMVKSGYGEKITDTQVQAVKDFFSRTMDSQTYRHKVRAMIGQEMGADALFTMAEHGHPSLEVDKALSMVMNKISPGHNLVGSDVYLMAHEQMIKDRDVGLRQIKRELAKEQSEGLSKTLTNFKFTPQTAAWGVGIAAGLYAFQKARTIGGIKPDTERPQPDVAPGSDGYYGVPEMQQSSTPIPRIIQDGTGYQGLNVRIRGVTDRSIDNEYLAQSISDSMQGHIPVPMNININTRDNRSNMNDQQIQEIVSRAIRGF